VTTNTTLWDYRWDIYGGNVVPNGGFAALAFDQFFLASHQYALTMMSTSGANTDSSGLSIQVSGLRRVPEPSTLLLLGIGAGAVAIKRRRRRPL
jgi:hypothetical protein